MRKQLKPIPKFANDAEEQAFWEKCDSTNYLDWTKAQRVVLPNLKPTTKTISLRLPQHLLDSIKAQRILVMCHTSHLSKCGCKRNCTATDPAQVTKKPPQSCITSL